MAETETLPIDRIATEDTQVRVTLSDIIIREYAEGLTRGDVFPPIDVFFDGEAYWLADGFHRVKATREAGLNTIEATVQQGGKRAALLHAVGANEEHGHRRTDADRRRAVHLLLTDPEWQAWNNSEIARHCHVSEFLVRTVRHELEPLQETHEPPERTRKVTRRGTTYPMRTERIGTATPPKARATTRPAPGPELAPSTAISETQASHTEPSASLSSIASKTDIPPVSALYVHQEEIPAGPAILSAQTEDESHTEPTSVQPQPRLMDVWQQANDDERTAFVAAYHDELRMMLAAWDAQTQQRTRTPPAPSPRQKPKKKRAAKA
jgi:ParB-like nuclease domain